MPLDESGLLHADGRAVDDVLSLGGAVTTPPPATAPARNSPASTRSSRSGAAMNWSPGSRGRGARPGGITQYAMSQA